MPKCIINQCIHRLLESPNIQFFKVPSWNNVFEAAQRRFWAQAIREAGCHAHWWTGHICSAHFISGVVSLDVNHEDYCPSVFTAVKERVGNFVPDKESKESKKEERVIRENGRGFAAQPMQRQRKHLIIQDTETISEKAEIETQTEAFCLQTKSSFPNPARITELKKSIIHLKRLITAPGCYRCETCCQTFTSTSLLVKHIQTHEVCEESFMCELCGEKYTSRADFADHQANHPKIELDFLCDICHQYFSTPQNLKNHKLLHRKNNRGCLKCGAKFCNIHTPSSPPPQAEAKITPQIQEERSPEKTEPSQKKELLKSISPSSKAAPALLLQLPSRQPILISVLLPRPSQPTVSPSPICLSPPRLLPRPSQPTISPSPLCLSPPRLLPRPSQPTVSPSPLCLSPPRLLPRPSQPTVSPSPLCLSPPRLLPSPSVNMPQRNISDTDTYGLPMTTSGVYHCLTALDDVLPLGASSPPHILSSSAEPGKDFFDFDNHDNAPDLDCDVDFQINERYDASEEQAAADAFYDFLTATTIKTEINSSQDEHTPSPSPSKEPDTLTKDETTFFDAPAASSQSSVPYSTMIPELSSRKPVVLLKPLLLPDGGYQCEKCCQTFSTTSMLVQHITSEHEEKTSALSEISITNVISHADVPDHLIFNQPKMEPSFPCNICDRSFTKPQELKRHKLLHVKDGRKCLKCGVIFCRRHNHVAFLPRAEIKVEEEEELPVSNAQSLYSPQIHEKKEYFLSITPSSPPVRPLTSPLPPPAHPLTSLSSPPVLPLTSPSSFPARPLTSPLPPPAHPLTSLSSPPVLPLTSPSSFPVLLLTSPLPLPAHPLTVPLPSPPAPPLTSPLPPILSSPLPSHSPLPSPSPLPPMLSSPVPSPSPLPQPNVPVVSHKIPKARKSSKCVPLTSASVPESLNSPPLPKPLTFPVEARITPQVPPSPLNMFAPKDLTSAFFDASDVKPFEIKPEFKEEKPEPPAAAPKRKRPKKVQRIAYDFEIII